MTFSSASTPRPYQFTVDQKKAALAEAEQTVLQLKAALDVANAAVTGAEASRDRSLQAFEKFQQSNENSKSSGRGAVYSEPKPARFPPDLGSSGRHGARASHPQKLAYESEINGTNLTVARLQAELRNAEYDLEQTVGVRRAPATSRRSSFARA